MSTPVTYDVLATVALQRKIVRERYIDLQGMPAMLRVFNRSENTRDDYGEMTENHTFADSPIRIVPDFKRYLTLLEFYSVGYVDEDKDMPLVSEVKLDLDVRVGDKVLFELGFMVNSTEFKVWEVVDVQVYSYPTPISKKINLVPDRHSPQDWLMDPDTPMRPSVGS